MSWMEASAHNIMVVSSQDGHAWTTLPVPNTYCLVIWGRQNPWILLWGVMKKKNFLHAHLLSCTTRQFQDGLTLSTSFMVVCNLLVTNVQQDKSFSKMNHTMAHLARFCSHGGNMYSQNRSAFDTNSFQEAK